MSSDPNSGGGPHDPLPAIPEAVPASPRSVRSRLVAPLATVAAVAVVAAGAGLFFSGRGDNHPGSPPVLHLADRAVTLAAPVEGLRDGPAVGVAGSRLELSGTLPDGPDHANVRTFGTGRAPRDRVAALAEALGLSGHPERHGQAWRVRSGDSGGQVLSVSDSPGWQWTLAAPFAVVRVHPTVRPPVRIPPAQPPASASPPVASTAPDPLPVPIRTVPTMSCLVIIDGHRACPPPTPLQRHAGDLTPGPGIPEQPEGTAGTATANRSGPVGSPGASSGSGSAGSTGGATSSGPAAHPTPLPATPDPDAIRAAAKPVLAGLGLTHPDLTVTTSPGRGQVTANPVVGGLPTSSMSTMLSFDTSAHLTFGTGWLAVSRPGARYPLATARSVLDARPTGPEVKCEPCPRSAPPTTVTGARLGLALNRTDRGGPVLVPAWFYDLRGSDRPLVLIAVDPTFLGAPRGLPGKHPGAYTGRAGRPGVVQPVPPVSGVRPPVSPAPRPTG